MSRIKLHIIRDLDTGEVLKFDSLGLIEWVLSEDCTKRSNFLWENGKTGKVRQFRKQKLIEQT